jgi:transposase-like protein
MTANMIAPAQPEKTRTRCAWTSDEQAEWMRLLEESGKGLSEFCRENGLPESTVSLWRKRLRQPTTDARDEEFIEVSRLAQPSVSAVRGATATIWLERRVALDIPVGADPAWVADLVCRLRSSA